MTTPPPMSPAKWYYRGQDDQEHGPFESNRMIMWSKTGYFNDMLLVRTENDPKYYPLVEWSRACGNQLPFLFPIVSMESLMMDRMNALNLGHHGQQVPPPPAPTVATPTPMRVYSGPVTIAPPPAPQPTGPIMVSYPAGIPPPPANSGPVFSPNHPQQYVVPTGYPYSMVQNQPHHHPNGYYANASHQHLPELEHPSSTVSNTPDSEPMHELLSHCDKNMSTSDAPWQRRIDRGTSPVLSRITQETQTSPILLSTEKASLLLSQLLEMSVEVVPGASHNHGT